MFRHLPPRGQGFLAVLAAAFLLVPVAAASDRPASPEALWKKLEPFASQRSDAITTDV